MSETPEEKKNPKDVHLKELSAELRQWEQKKKEIESIAGHAGGPTVEEDLRELHRRYEEARSALNEAEKSPDKAWVKAKDKADQAFSSLRDHASKVKARGEASRPVADS